MSEITTRPAAGATKAIARTDAPAPERCLPASPVLPLQDPVQMAGMFGVQIIQTHSALFPPLIEARDVIEVDFDVRSIRCDTEYLISIADDDGGQWFMARRFQFRLDGQLWMADPDGTDGGAWRVVTPSMLNSITVYGEVREVYKPTSKLMRAA